MNAESVYILEVKKEKGRQLHYIEIDLAERGLKVYDSKGRKRVIYLETNFDFVGVLRIQNNGRVLFIKGQELVIAGSRICRYIGVWYNLLKDFLKIAVQGKYVIVDGDFVNIGCFDSINESFV